MAVSSFSLQNFKHTVLGEGLARVNRFEVLLTAPVSLPSYQYLGKTALYCEVSNFPPITLNVKPFKIFGPSYQRPISSEYGGDGMSMTFHVDRTMGIKRFFDDWIQKVVDVNGFFVSYQNEYVSRIYVRQLDEANNVTYEIELLEAFPRSISLMELNNTAQNQTHRLNVIFGYRYWRRTDIPQNLTITTVRPRVSQQTQPVIQPLPVQETDTSRTLDSLGGGDPNVSFEESTFSVPSA